MLYYDPKGCNGIISNNVWDYYFYPVSNLTYTKKDQIHFFPFPPDGFCVQTHPKRPDPHPDQYLRHYMNDLINRYIRIKEPTLNKIEEFYIENFKGKYTISIHLRGTDKWTEVPPIPLADIFAEANKYVPCQFFIATDEESILGEAKKMLQGKVISYNSTRLEGAQTLSVGVHNATHGTQINRAYLGEEALIDCILLSRCDLLIHTWSNLSITALLFNPDMLHIHLGR